MLKPAVPAEAAAAAAPNRPGLLEWGLDLPERAVPRRISRQFKFSGPRVEVLGEIKGPGCIRRIWITGGNIGREATLRIFFDGEAVPYVEAPLGEFFGAMHNLMSDKYPHDHTLRQRPEEAYTINTPFLAIKPKNGFTSYFAMPFAKSARLEVTGSGSKTNLFYIIDWHEYPDEPLREPLRFAARWRREAPVEDYRSDYLMLDADGPGRLVGFVYAVDMLKSRHEMRWSHAGADNIYVDGDGEYPAFLRGIGGEDSFGTSYSGGDYLPQTSLYSDMPYYVQKDSEGNSQKLVGYRFFVNERIDFTRSIHARFGARAHDISSMVYWYSAVPVRPFVALPAPGTKLPGSVTKAGEFDKPLPDTGRWLTAGPFNSATARLPRPDERVTPSASLEGKRWQEFSALRGFVEFNHPYRPEPSNRNSPVLEGAAIASSVLIADRDTTATLTLGWTDRLKFTVNDEPAVEFEHAPYFRSKKVEVKLRAGPNRISVLLYNAPQEKSLDRGSWNFSFSAVDASGRRLIPQSEASVRTK